MQKGFTVFLVLISCLFLWYVFSLPKGTANTTIQPQPTPVEEKVVDEVEVFNLVNEYRIENGLKALVWDNFLCSFIEDRPRQVSVDYSHSGFRNAIKTPAIGKNYLMLGENLNRGDWVSSEDMFNSWTLSESHNNNILKADWLYSCINCEEIIGRDYCVQWFAY